MPWGVPNPVRELGGERLLDYAEVADLIGVPETTVRAWHRHHRIPFVRVSYKVVRFRVTDVLEFVRAGRRAATPPP